MYIVGADDRPIRLSHVPEPEPGAPCPMLLCGENDLALAYYVSGQFNDWDGTSAKILTAESEGLTSAVVKFQAPYAHMFGPPNDEAFDGHPLAARGLTPYAVFQVEHSSWIRQLERMNAVHKQHRSEHFDRYKHFIFAFHDSTLEVVADGFKYEVRAGSVRSLLVSGQSH